MSLTVLHKYLSYLDIYCAIDKSGSQSMKLAHDRWSKRIMDGCYLFSNHDTSNIPNILNPTVNSSLASQTKCDNMFSDPESDHISIIFLGYVPGLYFVSSSMW